MYERLPEDTDASCGMTTITTAILKSTYVKFTYVDIYYWYYYCINSIILTDISATKEQNTNIRKITPTLGDKDKRKTKISLGKVCACLQSVNTYWISSISWINIFMAVILSFRVVTLLQKLCQKSCTLFTSIGWKFLMKNVLWWETVLMAYNDRICLVGIWM